MQQCLHVALWLPAHLALVGILALDWLPKAQPNDWVKHIWCALVLRNGARSAGTVDADAMVACCVVWLDYHIIAPASGQTALVLHSRRAASGSAAVQVTVGHSSRSGGSAVGEEAKENAAVIASLCSTVHDSTVEQAPDVSQHACKQASCHICCCS